MITIEIINVFIVCVCVYTEYKIYFQQISSTQYLIINYSHHAVK